MDITQIDKMRKLQDRLVNRSCTEDNLKTSLLLMEAAETIGNLLTNSYEWISVEDRLPEPFVNVLAFRNGKISIDYHEENGWFAYDFEEKRATHWMPLPSPPTEKEN